MQATYMSLPIPGPPRVFFSHDAKAVAAFKMLSIFYD